MMWRTPMMTQSVGVPFDREMPLADFAQAQRIVQRQRMRHAGLIGFRRHDPDVVGQRARDFFASLEARRVDAVVIGDENTHYFFSIFVMPPI